LFLRQEAQQQPLGGIGIARERAVGGNGGDEFDHQIVEHFLGDRAQAGHGAAELLDLQFVQFIEDRLAIIGAQRQQQRGRLFIAGQHALIGVVAHHQLPVIGGGHGILRLRGGSCQSHVDHAALPSQSRTISAAWRGFSSTSVPTVLSVCSWVSPMDLALATQAGVLSRPVSASALNASTLTSPSAPNTPCWPTSAAGGSARGWLSGTSALRSSGRITKNTSASAISRVTAISAAFIRSSRVKSSRPPLPSVAGTARSGRSGN